jgi:hypothetical protein
VVEAKWSHSKKWRRGETVPGDVQAQVQWQLFVVGWDVADVIVMDFGRPRVETLERDARFIDDLLYFARDFRGYLDRGELPPVDASESTRQTLTRRYPRDNGIVIAPTPDLVDLAGRLAETRAAKKAADDAERSVASAIRAILGEASEVEGLLSLRANRDSTRVNWPAVAKAFRTLLAERSISEESLAAIESIHSETAEGARVLRLLKGASE